MPPIQVVSFDFFNTLAFHRGGLGRGRELTEYVRAMGLEPAPWEHRTLYRVFENHLRACPPASDLEALRQYRMHLAGRAFDELGVSVSEAEVAQHAEALWKILGPASLELFPEVRETLAALSEAGVRMAVISNWQSGLLHFLDELGILPAFEAVFCSDDLGVEKPDPTIFAEAAGALRVRPSAILHVGDTYLDDYEGGQQAGFRTVLLNRQSAACPAGVRTIGHLGDVWSLLRSDVTA